MRYTLHSRQLVPRAIDEVFAFYAEPENLAVITPSWLGFKIVDPLKPVMAPGLRITYRIHPLGIPQRWVSEITAYEPPHRFVDEQRVGPYTSWHHEHVFESIDGGTAIIDTVTYEVPLGPLGRIANWLFVRRQLESIFAHRERVIAQRFGTMP